MKTGLVLEGGGMRGMFTVGVTDVLMENGLEFDGLIGVSAGAVFGCNIKSKQPGRAIRYNMKYCRDSRYCSFRSLRKTGDLFGVDFCYRELPQKLDLFDDDTYISNPLPFYVVCTDVETGKAVYHLCENDVENDLKWMQASASMPLAARMVEIDGKKYLDGGVADSVPLCYFQSIGYEKNLVILTQPKGYVKGKNKALPLIKRAYKGYPDFISTVAHRHEVYNETLAYIEEQEKSGKTLVIRPDEKLPVGRVEHNPEKLREVYEIGRKIGKVYLEEIKAFLKK
ncbi:MAG: patatin family protein [Firmicutes bacterium]|nr:patatin family protein [Bacillota bacterium]